MLRNILFLSISDGRKHLYKFHCSQVCAEATPGLTDTAIAAHDEQCVQVTVNCRRSDGGCAALRHLRVVFVGAELRAPARWERLGVGNGHTEHRVDHRPQVS